MYFQRNGRIIATVAEQMNGPALIEALQTTMRPDRSFCRGGTEYQFLVLTSCTYVCTSP